MKLNKKRLVLGILLLGVLNGCSALIPDFAIKNGHSKMDTNGDGYIDYKEYLNSIESQEYIESEAKKKNMTVDEYLKWDFSRADFNGDAKISVQELIRLVREDG